MLLHIEFQTKSSYTWLRLASASVLVAFGAHGTFNQRSKSSDMSGLDRPFKKFSKTGTSSRCNYSCAGGLAARHIAAEA